MAQLEFKVREIDLGGMQIMAAGGDLHAQVVDLIAKFDAQSMPLMHGLAYTRTHHESVEQPNVRVNIVVDEGEGDATLFRLAQRAPMTSEVSAADVDADGIGTSMRRLRLSDGPVHFVAGDGETITRIVYRRP